MDFLGIIFLLLIYFVILRNFYFAWFNPKKYFDDAEKTRKFINENIPFVLNLWTTKAIINNPKIDLFWARLGSLFMIIVSTLVMLNIIF
jgi:hypothetical protein